MLFIELVDPFQQELLDKHLLIIFIGFKLERIMFIYDTCESLPNIVKC